MHSTENGHNSCQQYRLVKGNVYNNLVDHLITSEDKNVLLEPLM